MAVRDEPEDALAGQVPLFEDAAARIRELNERLLESAMAAGSKTLDAYEKALRTLASTAEAGASPLDWVATIAQVHAEFVRDVTIAHTAALRILLD
jgi:hypothetical protein